MTGILGPMPTDEALTEAADPVRARVALARLLERPTARARLGGRELNYASDVDVIFVHREGGAQLSGKAIHSAAGLIALLSEPGPGGIVLRVDPDLRPEGRAGPLSRSLEAMGDYYARHAATWERQALLKARPVAGDPALGAEF